MTAPATATGYRIPLAAVAVYPKTTREDAGRQMLELRRSIEIAERIGHTVELTARMDYGLTLNVAATIVGFRAPWSCANELQHENGGPLAVTGGRDTCPECGRAHEDELLHRAVQDPEQLRELTQQELEDRAEANEQALKAMIVRRNAGDLTEDERALFDALCAEEKHIDEELTRRDRQALHHMRARA